MEDGGEEAGLEADRAEGSSGEEAGPEADHTESSGGYAVWEGIYDGDDVLQVRLKLQSRLKLRMMLQAGMMLQERMMLQARMKLQTRMWKLQVVALQATAWKPHVTVMAGRAPRTPQRSCRQW